MKYDFNPFTHRLDKTHDLSSISGHMIPTTTCTYDLGSATVEWRNVYLNGVLDMDPTITTGTANRIIDIENTSALTANAHLTHIRISGDNLDPAGADTRVRGLAVNFSGIDPGVYETDVDAVRIIMPSASTWDAIRIKGGKVRHLYTAGTDALAQYTVHDISLDVSGQDSSSETHALDVALSSGLVGDVAAVATHPGICPIHQHIGTYTTITLDALYIDGTGYAAFGDENIWAANNDAICVGHSAKFDEVELTFDTVATKDCFLKFYYWKDLATDTWIEFYPEDDTDGGRQDGVIRFSGGDLTDWLSADPTGQGAGYWIKIERNRTNDPGTVNLASHKYLVAVTYDWNKDGDIQIRKAGIGRTRTTHTLEVDSNLSIWSGASSLIDLTTPDIGGGSHAGKVEIRNGSGDVKVTFNPGLTGASTAAGFIFPSGAGQSCLILGTHTDCRTIWVDGTYGNDLVLGAKGVIKFWTGDDVDDGFEFSTTTNAPTFKMLSNGGAANTTFTVDTNGDLEINPSGDDVEIKGQLNFGVQAVHSWGIVFTDFDSETCQLEKNDTTNAFMIECSQSIHLITNGSLTDYISVQNNTEIEAVGGGDLTFIDAVAGTLTLSEMSCPPYIYIAAATQSEGDLHLSDATNWNTDEALIKSIRIVTSSTDWDLYLLQNDNSHATNDANIPELLLVDGGDGNEIVFLDRAYEDEDASKEVHLYWVDNIGTDTADIYITGFKLR